MSISRFMWIRWGFPKNCLKLAESEAMMRAIFLSRQNLKLTITCILALVAMWRKLIAKALGCWLVAGAFSWGLVTLINGQLISPMFFSLGYVSLTMLFLASCWKLYRYGLGKPIRQLQLTNR